MTGGLAGRNRHVWLLATLVTLLFVRPVIGDSDGGVNLLELLTVAALLVGAVSTSAGRRLRVVLFALAATAIVARLVSPEGDPTSAATLVFIFAYIAFFSIVVVLLVGNLLREGARVTFDTLCGAFSAYLILGLIWMFFYMLLELAEPGSLVLGSGEPLAASDSGFDRFLGFSFATLTTLGYGNIAPATERADAIATLEAVVGQVFVAVVIARLVALQITQDSASA